MEPAPYHNDIAEGPVATAYWLEASDGVRIRIAIWEGGHKGTVLLFPGRTEYIEKYGRAAAELLRRGYSTLAIDWRGQGLSDRLGNDRQLGHVGEFLDYQSDLQAALRALPALDMPEPRFLLAHSMGGCIGLRALLRGLDVRAAAFSAPMWDIRIAPMTRPFAWLMAHSSSILGIGQKFAPGTGPKTYVLESGFAGNVLTTDAEMYRHMQRQVSEHPELSLGGPSLHWLSEALHEIAELRGLGSPGLPTYCALGTNEKVVDQQAVIERMKRWPSGKLELFPGAEHEVIMEGIKTRTKFFDAATALFDAQLKRA